MRPIDRVRYGKVVGQENIPSGHSRNEGLPVYHVAGPVSGTDNALFNQFPDLREIIGPWSSVQADGQVHIRGSVGWNERICFGALCGNLARLYLQGERLNIDKPTPINETLFMLPLPRDVMKRFENMFSGLTDRKVSGELISGASTQVAYFQGDPFDEDSRYNLAGKIELNKLFFWELPSPDHSDHVRISITQRDKDVKKGTRKNLIIERDHSSATASGPLGTYKPVSGELSERVVLSGTQTRV